MKRLLSLVVSLSLAFGAVAEVSAATVAPAGDSRGLPELAPAPQDALSRALVTGTVDDAEYALERALTLFDRSPVARRFGEVAAPAPRDATALLRDLALRKDQLAPDDRAVANALLARPTDGKRQRPGKHQVRGCQGQTYLHPQSVRPLRHDGTTRGRSHRFQRQRSA